MPPFLHRTMAVCAACLGLAVGGTSLAAETPVERANRDAVEAVRFSNTPPPAASRWLAILHLAQFDAVNALGGPYRNHRDHGTPPAGASAPAAAAAAANQVLRHAWPAFTIAFDAALQAELAAMPDGDPVRDGVAWGRAVALDLIREREFDGSQRGIDHRPSPGPGRWEPTPPLFDSALLPQWAVMTPFLLPRPDAFRPGPPPPPATDAWAAEFEEVRLLGARDSTLRTPDQTAIGRFWADGPGTVTPPGHWNRIARLWMAARGNGDLVETARVFAVLNLALADAAIATWDSKYAYDVWRPVTAIRAAAGDGHPATQPDAGWLPLVDTPPFPEYVSGHSTFSAAAAAVLAHVNGDDRFAFALESDGLSGVERAFGGFSGAADEAGLSRIYGGIHFQSANRAGRDLGRAVARHTLLHALRHRDDPTLRLSRSRAGLTLSWPPDHRLEASPDPLHGPWEPVPTDPATPGITTRPLSADACYFRVGPPANPGH